MSRKKKTDQDKEKKKKTEKVQEKLFFFCSSLVQREVNISQYIWCELKKYDNERANIILEQTKGIKEIMKVLEMEIICRYLIDHLCSSARQRAV